MLYFMGLNDSEGNWTGSFTAAVRSELVRRGVSFRELPPYDWYADGLALGPVLRVRSRPSDSWFISWAQSPLIELIRDMPGRKYGLVVGLTAMPFEPAVLMEAAEGLRERERLSLYDGIFVNSQWCRECLCRAYPELASRVVVTGFPFDYRVYDRYVEVPRDPELVVFNQRFALEKLHIIEVEVARRLVERGYRVQHFSGTPAAALSRWSVSTRQLLKIAERVGLELVHNPDKDTYHERLASAAVVVTTSIADMLPSSLIEAVYMGAVPVAPDAMCFPEFIHQDNLYTPYDIEEIISLVEEAPVREYSITGYDKSRVVGRFLEEMGID